MRHLINSEIEHNSDPPTQDYELGKWHASRGHFEEALKCFKQGAIRAVHMNPLSPIDNKGPALSWIEYGRLNTKLNKYDEASTSFRQALSFGLPYASIALEEWAMMLSHQGVNDHDIFNQLSEELSSYSITPSVLGCALTEIGAYKEAIICFNMSPYTDTSSGIKHIRCLISDGCFDEAINLLIYLNSKCISIGWKCENDHTFIRLALFLCRWRLRGSLPYLPASEDDRIKLASIALSVGMISEADSILSREGINGEHALIFMLYSEGYIDLAMNRLKQLPDLAMINSTTYQAELQFISAEYLYDLGDYDKASTLFENIRLSKIEHANARFGEAACYLQTALISLSSRISRLDCSKSIKEQTMEYMHNINAALHIVENTNWHTTWTPAQERRKHRIKQTHLLN